LDLFTVKDAVPFQVNFQKVSVSHLKFKMSRDFNMPLLNADEGSF